MNEPHLRLTLPATKANVSLGSDAVRDFLAHHSVPDEVAHDVMIIFDELASNIVRYAWCDGQDHAFETELRLLPAEGTLWVTLTDDGIPFDPTQAPMPPPVETIGDLVPGGLGLALARALSNGMTYAHTGGCNQIQVCKRLFELGLPRP